MPYLGKQPASVPVTADDIPNDSITTAKIVDAAITIADIGPNAVGSSEMADDAVGLNELSATGTTNSSTFLRGDNTWAVPPDTNTTYSVQDGQLSQNNFTDADHSKLNAIEASADVTDATNVSAAGALMKSGGTMTGNTVHGDNVKSTYGDSVDLAIYHDGNDSLIEENGTGNLQIRAGNFYAMSANGQEVKIRADDNGAVELYHDNSKKIETTSSGIEVTGDSKATRIVGRGVIENSSGVSGDTWAVMGLNTTNAAGSGGAVFGSKHADSNALLIGTHDATFNSFVVKGNGKVGIGTTSPTAVRLHITTNSQGTLPSLQADADDVVIENSTPGITLMGATNGGGMLAFGDTDDADVGRIFYYHVSNNMDFITNGDTRLSLRNDGQLISYVPAGASRTNMSFYNGGVKKGSIVTSDYTNNTTYNTSSDYRLKENVNYTWDATTRLKQLKPARFNWIADDTNTLFDGFIAHEVQEIIPEAITGEKDAMTTNENGDAIIDPQGIDQSKLVPLLVKAMQEQQTTIESLTARITALEG